ncbi:Ketosteroid isomerase-related protein [Nannocystis exedens]|uniref:Ketosteroid isomerase-related protein n=1 Tax=Nannocystis exedens TaxID=54 RepID=A0A1I2I7X0_9BACT|nr:nuclear transport factor 2 family protein [Nannocystis exedens]PCC73545.1 phenazine biosynthesis protein [Nannocystis exedens]SFF37728.1 Ketosteroid isomerase-related protein [Nannocystis exedens]
MQDHATEPMRAAAALAAHLERIARDIERWLQLFADDAVVEFPYALRLGLPPRLVGKPAIAAYFRRTPGVFRDLRFSDLRVYPTTDPDVLVAEVHGSATLAPTGEAYEQDYVMVLQCKDGRIVRYREYWDPTATSSFREGSVRDALGGE